MPITQKECAAYLSAAKIRHHYDPQDDVTRVVWITNHYVNRRAERLAIITLALPDSGRRFRLSIERAFDVGDDPAGLCLSLCCCAADTPLVGVEYDVDSENIRLVIDVAVEDGTLSSEQLLVMFGRLIEAAECWAVAVFGGRRHAA